MESWPFIIYCLIFFLDLFYSLYIDLYANKKNIKSKNFWLKAEKVVLGLPLLQQPFEEKKKNQYQGKQILFLTSFKNNLYKSIELLFTIKHASNLA